MKKLLGLLGKAGVVGPVNVAAISPATLTTNLALWLKADAYVGNDGDAVATWADSSGNGRDATQATAGKKPTYKTGIWNSLPVIRFDGGDGLGTAAVDLTAQKQMTWYAVASATDQTNQIIAEFSDNTGTQTTAAGCYLLVETASRLEVALKGSSNYNVWNSYATFEGGTTVPRVIHGYFDMLINRHETQGGIDGDTIGRRGSTPNYANNTGFFGNHPFNIGCRDADASVAATSLFLTGDIAEIIVYTGRHDAVTRAGIEKYLAQKYAVTAWTAPVANLVFESDSITEGGNTYFDVSYPQRLVNRLKDKVAWANPAVSGQTLDQMVADASTQIYPLSNRVFGGKNIVTLFGGTNDMVSVGGNQTAAATLTEFYSYGDALLAQGYKVLAFTALPRSDVAAPGDFETKRQAFNTDIRANYASHATALCDVAANTAIGDAGDELDTVYFDADKVHLNTYGLKHLANIVATSLAAEPFSLSTVLPSDITGLKGWWKADSYVGADNDLVATWADSSGSGNDATAAGALRPTYKTAILNGQPVMRFAGSQGMITPAIDLSASTGVTVIAVFSSSVSGADQVVLEMSTNESAVTDSFLMFKSTTNVARFNVTGNVGASTYSATGAVSSAVVFAATCDKTKATRETTAWKNGVISGTRVTNSNNTVAAFGNRACYIGARAQASLFLTGDIAELMLFNRSISGAERGRIEEYLAYKWGVF